MEDTVNADDLRSLPDADEFSLPAPFGLAPPSTLTAPLILPSHVRPPMDHDGVLVRPDTHNTPEFSAQAALAHAPSGEAILPDDLLPAVLTDIHIGQKGKPPDPLLRCSLLELLELNLLELRGGGTAPTGTLQPTPVLAKGSMAAQPHLTRPEATAPPQTTVYMTAVLGCTEDRVPPVPLEEVTLDVLDHALFGPVLHPCPDHGLPGAWSLSDKCFAPGKPARFAPNAQTIADIVTNCLSLDGTQPTTQLIRSTRHLPVQRPARQSSSPGNEHQLGTGLPPMASTVVPPVTSTTKDEQSSYHGYSSSSDSDGSDSSSEDVPMQLRARPLSAMGPAIARVLPSDPTSTLATPLDLDPTPVDDPNAPYLRHLSLRSDHRICPL